MEAGYFKFHNSINVPVIIMGSHDSEIPSEMPCPGTSRKIHHKKWHGIYKNLQEIPVDKKFHFFHRKKGDTV